MKQFKKYFILLMTLSLLCIATAYSNGKKNTDNNNTNKIIFNNIIKIIPIFVLLLYRDKK